MKFVGICAAFLCGLVVFLNAEDRPISFTEGHACGRNAVEHLQEFLTLAEVADRITAAGKFVSDLRLFVATITGKDEAERYMNALVFVFMMFRRVIKERIEGVSEALLEWAAENYELILKELSTPGQFICYWKDGASCNGWPEYMRQLRKALRSIAGKVLKWKTIGGCASKERELLDTQAQRWSDDAELTAWYGKIKAQLDELE